MNPEQGMAFENQSEEENRKDKSAFGKRLEIIRIWADEFCSKSSVHGIRYITEKGKHWTEILWWVIAFGISVCLCGLSIRHLWNEWKEHPIVVSFEDTQTYLHAIPFPAVTVCSTTTVMSDSFNFTEEEQLINPESGAGVLVGDIPSEFKAALHMFSGTYQNFMIERLHENVTIGSIDEASGSFNAYTNRTIVDAKWLSNRITIDYFQPIYTNNGLCLTFNMLNSLELYTDEIYNENLRSFIIRVVRDLLNVNYPFNATHWSMEKGYASSNKNDSLYPFRVCAGGTYASLSFDSLFDIEGRDENCDGHNKEFYVSLHPPNVMPKMWNNFIRIPADHEVSISIEPKVMTTSEVLKKSYSSQQRQCFFVSERRLRFFKNYTQVNCEVECLAKLTVSLCNCVPFYLPRDNKTKICGVESYHCYKRASKEFYEPNPQKFLPNVAKLNEECDCLPACTSIQYDVDMSQIKGRISNYNRPLVASRLHIYFKNNYFIAMIRRQRFNITEFLANCGGLFGLFMGASLLSFIELIYYCSLRLIYSIARKSSRPEPIADVKNISIVSRIE